MKAVWRKFHVEVYLFSFYWVMMQEEAVCLLCTMINFFPLSVNRHYDSVSDQSQHYGSINYLFCDLSAKCKLFSIWLMLACYFDFHEWLLCKYWSTFIIGRLKLLLFPRLCLENALQVHWRWEFLDFLIWHELRNAVSKREILLLVVLCRSLVIACHYFQNQEETRIVGLWWWIRYWYM